MHWKIAPFENKDANYCLLPADTETDHHYALEYAQDRLEQGWDELAFEPFGTQCTVTIELCYGKIPDKEKGDA